MARPEPVEAELARPPILTPAEEDNYRLHPSREEASDSTVVGNHRDPELGEKLILVQFEQGESPRDFSKFIKWYATISVSFLCLAVAIGSSIVTGDIQSPVKDVHTNQEVVDLTVTMFVAGFGIGPLFLAPASEIVGRKVIYCISIFFYFIFTLPSALAHNSATLVVPRLIAGIAAGAPMTNVGGTISDIWAIEDRGVPFALFSGSIFLGPTLGPIIGSWIGERAGWRWIYWVLFIFVGACFVFTLFLPETFAPVLLKRKAKKLRKESGNDAYRAQEELNQPPLSETMRIALVRPFSLMFKEPLILFMSIYLSFIYSLLYLLFFAAPIAFSDIRGFGLGITGTTFVSVLIGILLALGLMSYQERVYKHLTHDNQHGFPEARLPPMMLGSIILPISLFIFAFTGAYKHVHWVGVCFGEGLFGMAMIFVYVSANSYIIDSYSDYAASAVAAKTTMRSLVGASVPLYVVQFFNNVGFQYAGLILALFACLIMPIPFIFWTRGEQIRARSARASKQNRHK